MEDILIYVSLRLVAREVPNCKQVESFETRRYGKLEICSKLDKREMTQNNCPCAGSRAEAESQVQTSRKRGSYNYYDNCYYHHDLSCYYHYHYHKCQPYEIIIM